MAKTKPARRVVIHLDPRMALEAIILNRLEQIPAARRQEWLRVLLVQGFRSECQVLRGVPETIARSSTTVFTQWLARASKSAARPKRASTVMLVEPSQVKIAGKPFAALGKVIGW